MQHDYSGVQEEVAPDQLRQLNVLVDRLGAADEVIAGLEQQLKEAEATARTLRENDIPELMQSIGLKELVTDSGLRVRLREEVRASFFTKEPQKREPAFEWLRQNHHDGLIKNEVSMKFNREQAALAQEVIEHLEKFGKPLNVEKRQEIHHQTLLAFIREQMREGNDVPLPLFGAMIQTFAKVERK